VALIYVVGLVTIWFGPETSGVALRDLDVTNADARHASSGATVLPTHPTPLIGRERELDRMRRWVANEGVRLLTRTGPAGIGKTRSGLPRSDGSR
jgi:hypothetical protein